MQRQWNVYTMLVQTSNHNNNIGTVPCLKQPQYTRGSHWGWTTQKMYITQGKKEKGTQEIAHKRESIVVLISTINTPAWIEYRPTPWRWTLQGEKERYIYPTAEWQLSKTWQERFERRRELNRSLSYWLRGTVQLNSVTIVRQKL